jgi:hypothetical protein
MAGRKHYGIRVLDFRRNCKFDSGFPSLSDCFFNVSRLREGISLDANDTISTQIRGVLDDGFSIYVKSMNRSGSVENGDFERMIEKSMSLRHPCLGFDYIGNCLGFI